MKVNRAGGLGKEIISKFGVNFYSLTDITDSTDLSLGWLLAMMKICVICAIREKKE